MRAFACLLLMMALASCGLPLSRDQFLDAPEARFLTGMIERLSRGEVDSIAADMYDQSDVRKNRAELERLAGFLEGSSPTSVQPAQWEVHKTSSGLRVVKVALEYGYESGRWFLMSGEIVGEPEQLRIANYRMKEIEFPLSVTNAFALSGKTSSHYAFLVMTVASFALSLCALVLCLRTRGLRRKRWWVLFIVFGLGTFTIDWSTGAYSYWPVSVLLMSAAFTRDGMLGPWTLEFAVPLGALVFLLMQRWRVAAPAAAPGGNPVSN